jgi:hypothetical protein
MDPERPFASQQSDPQPADLWLRAALAPEPGVAERVVAAALAAGGAKAYGFAGWRGLAAAAVLALAFGWAAFFLKPRPTEAPAPIAPAGGSYLMTNASGPLRLLRLAQEPASFRPLARPAPMGPCTTVYWSRGSVVAVYDSCGDGTILMEGGAS